MKLATWNVNSLAVRLPQLIDWLALHAPDAMCLQETKLADDKFPAAQIEAAGYRVHWFGQKTYNGVALLSRSEATEVMRNIPGHDDAQARVIAATVDGIRVIGAYVPNGQSVESEKFVYKLRWLEALRTWVADEMTRHPQLALLGDYNIAPEDRDVHDPLAWAGQVLCTPQERAQFQGLVDLGLHDSFRLFEQPEKQYSWWDYRMLGFQKNKGLRIDHILVSEALKPRITACSIDRPTRKNERPSDHAPVIVELTPA
ncbi:MAG: exodeoxyribonuclease III [Burkholderiaceae bacterium]